jgi:PAS domain-containing protein
LEALAESEQRFHELVEVLPDAILVTRLLAAEGPEQLIGRDISGIIDPLACRK